MVPLTGARERAIAGHTSNLTASDYVFFYHVSADKI